MAEGIVNKFFAKKYVAFSAGIRATCVNPNAVIVMREIGIDISGNRSKEVSEFWGRKFDYTITLCSDNAKTACPVFVGQVKHRIHLSFDDPAEARGSEQEVLAVFRRVRDEIFSELKSLLK